MHICFFFLHTLPFCERIHGSSSLSVTRKFRTVRRWRVSGRATSLAGWSAIKQRACAKYLHKSVLPSSCRQPASIEGAYILLSLVPYYPSSCLVPESLNSSSKFNTNYFHKKNFVIQIMLKSGEKFSSSFTNRQKNDLTRCILSKRLTRRYRSQSTKKKE